MGCYCIDCTEWAWDCYYRAAWGYIWVTAGVKGSALFCCWKPKLGHQPDSLAVTPSVTDCATGTPTNRAAIHSTKNSAIKYHSDLIICRRAKRRPDSDSATKHLQESMLK